MSTYGRQQLLLILLLLVDAVLILWRGIAHGQHGVDLIGLALFVVAAFAFRRASAEVDRQHGVTWEPIDDG